MQSRLHEAPLGQLTMKNLALQYVWWSKIYRGMQVHTENSFECVIAGKSLEPLTRTLQIGQLPPVVEPNEEMELDYASSFPIVWGRKKYGIDCFSNFASAQITSNTLAKSIKMFLQNFVALHGVQ